MPTSATYRVAGMTCAHCVEAVTKGVGQLDGVSNVTAQLVPGGESRITVTSDAPLPSERAREAVDEAGYVLVDMGPST